LASSRNRIAGHHQAPCRRAGALASALALRHGTLQRLPDIALAGNAFTLGVLAQTHSAQYDKRLAEDEFDFADRQSVFLLLVPVAIY
jgi:hypothetical protein